MTPQQQTAQQSTQSRLNTDGNDFAEYDYFYYLVENYPDGDTYFQNGTMPRYQIRLVTG